MISSTAGPLYRKVKGESSADRENVQDEVVVVPNNARSKLVPFAIAIVVLVVIIVGSGYDQVFQALEGASSLVSNTMDSAMGHIKGSGNSTKTKAGFSGAYSRLIAEVSDGKGGKLQILDEAMPTTCMAEQHADYDGYAVQWGLGHKTRSAAECCLACANFKGQNGVKLPCNVWVWCGDPSGTCWTMDIHKHTTGDCWLKFQKEWDNVTNFDKTNLKVNHRGRFKEAFRAEHKTAPELVPWTAGVVKQPKAS